MSAVAGPTGVSLDNKGQIEFFSAMDNSLEFKGPEIWGIWGRWELVIIWGKFILFSKNRFKEGGLPTQIQLFFYK